MQAMQAMPRLNVLLVSRNDCDAWEIAIHATPCHTMPSFAMPAESSNSSGCLPQQRVGHEAVGLPNWVAGRCSDLLSSWLNKAEARECCACLRRLGGGPWSQNESSNLSDSAEIPNFVNRVDSANLTSSFQGEEMAKDVAIYQQEILCLHKLLPESPASPSERL